MTKLHRDIAVRLLECVEDEEFTDQATIKVRKEQGPRGPEKGSISCIFVVGIISEDQRTDQQHQNPYP